MEIQKKITILSENLNNLRSALEDFRDHHISKKEKIKNLNIDFYTNDRCGFDPEPRYIAPPLMASLPLIFKF